MRDYIRRFLIAVIMGLFVSLLFLGGKQADAGKQSQEVGKTKAETAYYLPITSQSNFF
jgi:hypothetical protein